MIFCDLLKSVSTTWPMLLKVLRAAGYISSAGGSSKTSRQPAPWSSVPANFLSKIICSHMRCCLYQAMQACRHVKTTMSRAEKKRDGTPHYVCVHRLCGLRGSRFCRNPRAHVGKQAGYGIQRSNKVLICTNPPGQTSDPQQAGTIRKALLIVLDV